MELNDIDDLPLHPAVRLICRSCLPSDKYFPNILRRIDEFVDDFPGQKCFNAACERGASAQSLEYLLGRSAPNWVHAIEIAAENGHLQVLQWMATKRKDRRGPWKNDFKTAMEKAAAQSHLEVVSWLYKNVSKDSTAVVHAARNGHLSVVQWLYEQGEHLHDAMDFAASNDQLEVVKWLYQHGCNVGADAMKKVVERGRLDAVQWFFKDLNAAYNSEVMDAAAAHGHLEIVKWLDANMKGRGSITVETFRKAAINGHLDVMKWVRDQHGAKGGRLVELMDDVASRGHLHILKWLQKEGSYGVSNVAMEGAVANGHLEVVKWLHDIYEEGCTVTAMDDAAANGHLAVLEWMHHHCRGGCTTRAMDSAASSGHLDVIRWLDENRTEGCSEKIIENAAGNGHVEVVRWLYEHYQFPTKALAKAAASAASCGCLEIVQMFATHSWFSHRKYLPTILVGAFSGGNVTIVEWLLRQGHQLRPIDRIWNPDLKITEIIYRGTEVSVPDARTTLLHRENLRMARWLSSHGCTLNLQLYRICANRFFRHNRWTLLCWQMKNGVKFDEFTAWPIFERDGCPEVTKWLSEASCVSIVTRALMIKSSVNNHLDNILWVLENVEFLKDSSHVAIRNALEDVRSDIRLWFQTNLVKDEVRRWCFSSDVDDESGRPSKRGRHN